ncbi:GntT/GntP/DsdX family permease [Kurthia sibirica]|uniref:2-keto-3-deoxygluconate permease n=1 Tax=Kurthia sibirica TaxID=202750 RepID=A0A2U3AP40_9BACL|nr:gluconate:H+ symporter [Kurthia sibirica]PWI26320.1 2-keto-3-deoxygluconate permease [Kurthia sibirica]GEK35012.1 2-keto-3-deoxygluconate permease [Kurthia sibirica]
MSHEVYLLLCTVVSIVIVILGVAWWKWHAFISLLVASLFLALATGLSFDQIVTSYEAGVGSVLGHLVGILALGTILGKLMADSGAGKQIAEFFIRIFGIKKLPWAMLLSGFIIGIPVFFDVGVVMLLPLVISIYKSTKQNILLIALPVLAGLSIVHGIVPPHPGAMTAIGIYNASVGKVLVYSLLIAIIPAIIAGPVFAKWAAKRIKPINEPNMIDVKDEFETLPTVRTSFLVILLPIFLMVLAVIAPYIGLPEGILSFVKFIGNAVIALLIACFTAMFLLGKRQGMSAAKLKKIADECLLPVGSIILIIGAGGGFKQILIDSGVGLAIANMSEDLSLSPLLLAFLVAGLIRVATGSATVALTTAAGIVAPVVANMTDVNLELLVIATGAGSLMLSHVNDAGFWMIKEYLGLTVTETFKTWTVLETILSFLTFGIVMLVNVFL